jgi:hypothetical protein
MKTFLQHLDEGKFITDMGDHDLSMTVNGKPSGKMDRMLSGATRVVAGQKSLRLTTTSNI